MLDTNTPIAEVVEAHAGDLISRVHEMKLRNARFVTATCLDRGGDFELIYHFEIADALEEIRLRVKKGQSVPSISQVYLSAILIENEIRDFFGLRFADVAIDFGARLLLHKDALTAPLLKRAGPATAERRVARCVAACPCGIDIPRYVRLVGQGRYQEALEVVREYNPLPAICGRVCFAPCERACRQMVEKRPVAIRLLKRYASDQVPFASLAAAKKPDTGKRVKIVGSGPAGLAAAYYLARLGHRVTILEALPKTGGMLRVGIPDYRLPQDVLDAEIKTITDLGVEIRTNTYVDEVDSLFADADAVFVALGAHENTPAGIDGEDHPAVQSCVAFLRDVNLGKKIDLGDSVAVIGGGNSAIDSARTALRCGSKAVTILYRRTRKEMPASEEEVHFALEEGVKIEFLVAPIGVVPSSKPGKVGLKCIRMQLGAPDASGRAKPVPVPGSEHVIDLDSIVAAIGQRPQIPAAFDFPKTKWGTFQVDAATQRCGRPGLFAGGDVARGPASVVEAIADGRRAALSIDKYLGGEGKFSCLVAEERVPRLDAREAWKGKGRAECPHLDAQGRAAAFDEVERGFPASRATEEANRCWCCDWND